MRIQGAGEDFSSLQFQESSRSEQTEFDVEALKDIKINPNISEESILEAAKYLITKSRREDYREAEKNFEDIARMWSVVLEHEVTAEQVGLMMACLKIVRASYRYNDDDIIDAIGYLALTKRIRDVMGYDK